MKKQFSRNLNSSFSGSRGRTTFSLWPYASALLVVLILVALRVFVPGTFVAISSPAFHAGSSLTAGVSNVFAGFDNAKKLAAQNAVLATQVATLTNENQVLTARSQDLTKLLGGEANSVDELLAGVLARPPESPYDSLLVSAGTNDGIVNDAYVYSAGGTPIGTISEVNKTSSQVSLFSTSGRTTSGWVGANRIPVALIGLGAGAFSATISAGVSSVAVGDTVYVPGPGALPIGTVASVDVDPSSPTPVIHVQPLVNLFSITWVEVSRASS